MKIRSPLFLMLSMLIASLPCAQGTPDHELRVTERLLGTGRDGFVILRVEKDNLGSYHSSNEKHYLDHYLKQDDATRDEVPEVESTLVLDREYSKHPDAKPDELPVGTVKQKAGSGGVSLADLVEKYPALPMEWEEEKFRRMTADPTGGVSFESYPLIWGGFVKERFGVDRNSATEWKLDGVAEDADCIFLTVSTETQTRIVCMPRKTTKQVRARALLTDYYLVAGSLDTEAEAIVEARKMNDRNKEVKGSQFVPEVWSAQLPTAKTVYLVASPMKETQVKNEGFSKTEELLGIELEVRSSSTFGERVLFE